MNNENQLTREARSYAGFYLRTGSRTWFWGWGSPPTAAAEQPWAGVAEWLRRLRAQTALAGSNNHAASQEIEIDAQPGAENSPFIRSATQPPVDKRKFRFVCDRHFIGFVLR